MRKRIRFIARAVLLAVTLGVAITGLVAYFESQNKFGHADDFKDVDLVNVIAFAERADGRTRLIMRRRTIMTWSRATSRL